MAIKQVFQINRKGVFIGTPPSTIPSGETGRLNFGEECIIKNAFPIGMLFLTLTPENPETYFGGSWALYGTGRLLLGVDENQTTAIDSAANSSSTNYINTVRAKGGSNTTGALAWPTHNHNLTWSNDSYTNSGNDYGRPRAKGYSGTSTSYALQPIGGGGSHSNNMPSIACYIWERKEDNYWSSGNDYVWPLPSTAE